MIGKLLGDAEKITGRAKTRNKNDRFREYKIKVELKIFDHSNMEDMFSY